MLDHYVFEAGSKLNVRYVDPDQNRTEFQHLLEEYPVTRSLNAQGQMFVEQVVVVTSGDTDRFVTPSEDFIGEQQMANYGAEPTFNPPRAEESLTSAIYRVVSGRQRVICLTEGHGEWSLSGGERNLSDLSERLERYELELRSVTVNLDSAPDFDGCHALVVAGPQQPFLPEEAAHLERFTIQGGGDLVLLLDPIVRDRRFVSTGLEELARRMGVRVDNVEVVDAEAVAPFCGGAHPTAFIAAQPLPGMRRALRICVDRARPVSLLEGREGDAFLLTVTESAYGEVNAAQLSRPTRDEEDQAGPFELGVAVFQDNEAARTARIGREREAQGNAEVEAELSEDDRRGSMVLVVGDSDFLAQEHRQNVQIANKELVEGLFNTVADNTVLVAQPPREVERVSLTLTNEELNVSFLIFVLGLPLIAVAAGVSMWWTRRQ
jgi:hypothetical protein